MTEDLGEFFDTEDFAVACRRQRAGAPELLFAAVESHADQPLLDAQGDDFGPRITAAVHRLHFPAVADVRRDDTVVIGERGYTVERVELVADGREASAVLIEA